MEYDSIAMAEVQQGTEMTIPQRNHPKLLRALKTFAWHFLFAVFFAIATHQFIIESKFEVP